MEQERIDIDDFCHYYSVEVSFIHSLSDSGLITMISENDHDFIPLDEMARLEKFARMHYDLDINLAGLETIDHLLEKMESLQKEIKRLRGSMSDF